MGRDRPVDPVLSSHQGFGRSSASFGIRDGIFPGVSHTPEISQRKADHIAVAASGAADFKRTTLLEDVHLIHQSLPELDLDQVALETTLFGHRLKAPLVITGMTGGTEEASQLNRDLAVVAEEMGIAFGVGSQRAMVEHPELAATFRVRDAAPDVFLVGNIGGVQAREFGPAKLEALVADIGANALAVHLNPGQEMIQSGGDRDFRGVLECIRQLAHELSVPVIVKETGCGLSGEAASSLAAAGVKVVDVSGAGGTSWVAVEAKRAQPGSEQETLGQELWDWGVPTAVSVALCAQAGLGVIASGGLRSGYDVARAIALGAHLGGLAAPVLRAHRAGGRAEVTRYLSGVLRSLQSLALLCGCQRVGDLRRSPRHLGAQLAGWLSDLGLR